MTAKEVLKELFELAVSDDGCDLDKCEKCSVALQKNCGCYQYYKIIEKDLKILELLKKLPFEIYQNGGGDDWNWFVDTKQSFKISEEKAIKLKEWLNDK